MNDFNQWYPLSSFKSGDILEWNLDRGNIRSNLLYAFNILVSLDNPIHTWSITPFITTQKFRKIGTLSLAAQKSLPYKIIPYPDITGNETMERVPVGTLYEIDSYYWTYLKVAPDKHVLFDARSSSGEVYEAPNSRKDIFGQDVTNGWGSLATKIKPVGLIKGFVGT